MLRFILGRLVGAVFVLWIIVTITFFLMRFAPGGPFDQERELPPNVKANRWLLYDMGVEVATPEPVTITDVAPLEVGAEYPAGTYLATGTAEGPLSVGLMRLDGVPKRTYRFLLPNDGTLEALPVTQDAELPAFGRVAVVPKTSTQQYFDAIGNYAQLDFGVTFTSEGERTVSEELARAFPISMQLGLVALALAILIGVTIGLVAGLKQNTWIDYTAMSGAMIGISVPSMVLGPTLIAIFVLGLGWLPYGGWDPSPGSEWATWQIRLLPIVTLALTYAAPFARITRGGMLEVIRSDYIRTARAKGLGETRVVTRHALKGALLPTVSYLGPATARILTGSVVVERVFGIAGLSEFFVTPALNRDYPMVLGVVVVYSVLLIFLNLVVDIAYTFLDPRVKLS